MPEPVVTIVRVLNNNTVLVADDGVELVLASRGIGYGKKSGDVVPMGSSQRKYVETSIDKVGFLKSLSSLDPELFDTVARAVEMATDLISDLLPSVYVALADHLSFAVQRVRDGQSIENRILDEIRAAFPTEFAAAEVIIRYVNSELNVDLPVDEAAFVALHLNAARTGTSVKQPLQEANELSQLAELVTARMEVADVAKSAHQELLGYLLRLLDRLAAGRTRKCTIRHLIAQGLPEEMDVARTTIHKIAEAHSIEPSPDEAALLAVFLHGWRQGDGAMQER